MKFYKVDELRKSLETMTDDKYFDYQNGIENDFDNYIFTHLREHLKEVNGEKCLVGIDKYKVLNEYFTKTELDLSAKDCVPRFLDHMLGVPPKEYLSITTLEARFRELFKEPEYIDCVYLKRVQGGHCTACVSFETYQKLSKDESLFLLLEKKKKKALRNPDFLKSPEYRQYLLECEWEKSDDEYYKHINDENYWNIPFIQQEEKTFLMMKEVFSLFFTEFDFNSLANDRDESVELYQDRDFGERYQELDDKLDRSSYEGVYFQSRFNEKLIDIIADKVANKIIMALNEKGKL